MWIEILSSVSTPRLKDYNTRVADHWLAVTLKVRVQHHRRRSLWFTSYAHHPRMVDTLQRMLVNVAADHAITYGLIQIGGIIKFVGAAHSYDVAQHAVAFLTLRVTPCLLVSQDGTQAARPHWAKWNEAYVADADAKLKRAYAPRLPLLRSVAKEYDPHGVFVNKLFAKLLSL